MIKWMKKFFMRVPVAARARQPSSRYHAFRAILASKNHKAPQKPHRRYLDNFHTKRLQLPSIYDTGMMVFRDTMFPMVKNDLTTAIIDMVTLEREGGQIDRGLLKSVVDLFVEMGLGSMDTYRDGCAPCHPRSPPRHCRVLAMRSESACLWCRAPACQHQIAVQGSRKGLGSTRHTIVS